ncbi:MAG TPA: polysaccharide biosynthesis tyrosine autokinase [Candidatus Paceibacterota bacterium]|nr:polysaccharide biosynthesis tyrosine autokinase [Candidatus Paceibacterota bacterium]
MDSSKSPAQQESKLHFLDYWRIIRIRKTVILAVFLLVVITATVVTYILPETFSGTARMRVSNDATDAPSFEQYGVSRGYDPYFIQTEFEVIQSQLILGKVIDKLKLNEEWGKKYANGQALKDSESLELLKKSIRLTPVRNASMIEVEVFSDKPDEAARIANEIVDTYAEHRKQVSLSMLSTSVKALEEKQAEHLKKIDTAQKEVDSLRTELGISDLDPMNTAPTPTISADVEKQLQGQLIYLKGQEVEAEKRLTNLKSLTKKQQREAIQTALQQPDAKLSTLFNELDLAEQRLRSLEVTYTKEHDIYKNALAAVSDLNEKIDAAVEGILIGLQSRCDQIKAQYEEMSLRLENSRTNYLAMAEKSRPYYAAKRRLAELEQFNQILSVKIASQSADLKMPRTSLVIITDKATPNPEAVKPKKTLNIALGVIIGLIVGVGLAFFIEYLDTSVKTIDDVERTLQAPVLGVIPQNVGFLMEEGADSPHAEAYRVLRTNLLFSRKDDKLNSIAVVSAGAGEGKSTTILNLATVFAQNGARVVVVDSDLRRPTLHKIMRVTNNLGLTNYLLKQNTLEEVIQTSNLPSLDFMASGKLPSSSMGVLSSAQMKNLINELKQRYDYVFFDSPPIMGVSDASILASEVDITLQVIQYRRYPQPMNIRAKQMIEKVGGNLLGIVLNNINMSQDESYYYYSGYYHEYYSKNEDDEPTAEANGGDKTKLDIKPKY